jgi:signal transduction histidine kinase
VSHSLTELQRLIADLRPSHLDDLGLPAALRWYIGEIETRTGLRVALEVGGQVRPISAPVKIALFRVAQEALNNAVKHAGPTEICMKLNFGEEDVTLNLQDNGIGFDPERTRLAGRSSWGLLGMRERAALLGGEFQLDSAPGRGTLVCVTIPYQTDYNGAEAEKRDDDTIAAR